MVRKQQDKFDKLHKQNIAKYGRMIDAIYNEAIREAVAISGMVSSVKGDTIFSFSDYPLTHKRVDKLFQRLQSNLLTAIVNGVDAEWTLANNKNNELANMVFGNRVNQLTEAQKRRYYSNNDKAREAFIKRKEQGLSLSDRVWQYTDQFKEEIEMSLDIGIREGHSAAKMNRDLRQYLNKPDMLFRRVRNEHGQLELSKRAKAYHPGQGVYRSSYKNARRLAVTETNMAYRTADNLRYQKMDFVVGIEIHLSGNHTLNGEPFHDICDELAGKYPKDFKFTGWHPHCRCFVTSILKTPEEIQEDTQKILRGEVVNGDSVNKVDDVPQQFKTWVKDNAERIATAKSLPYFLKDNGSIEDGKWEYERTNNLIKQGSEPSFVQGAKIKYKNAIELYGSLKSTYNNEVNIKGVVKQKLMTHEEADGMRVNPQWKQVGSTTNCQASVIAYTLRREGYLVRAELNDGGSLFTALELNPEKAWIDKRTGMVPKTMKAGGMKVGNDRKMYIKSRSEMSNEFNALTAEVGMYQIMISWKRLPGLYGHTIVVERLKDGKLMVFDPQRGVHYKWRDYIKEIDTTNGIEILPLKGLAFNSEYSIVLKNSNN